jgi:transposase
VSQFVEDLPEPTTVLTRFDIAVGVCSCCGRRVQGRHPEQTSDALGAAASQIGPRALATAASLHKSCGMPLAKICAHFAGLGLFRSAYQQGADAIALLTELLRSPSATIAPLAMPLTGNPGP